ncbi:MAG: hypothetical protein AAFQ40_05065 [Cyanobacteria bacterium J06623_5]
MMVNPMPAATWLFSKRPPLSSICCLLQVLLVYGLASNSTIDSAVASESAQRAQPIISSATTQTAASQQTSKTVLVIHSYHSEFPWTARVKAGINQGFEESAFDVDVYHEFLDTKRYPDLAYQSTFLNYVQDKYRDTPIDLLMVGDDPGLRMIMETRDQYFLDLPVVFLGVNRVRPELLETPWLTGVFENHSTLETLVEAKRQTASDNLIVVVDSTSTGKGRQQKLEDLMNQPGVPQNIIVKTDLVADQIAETLGEYPDDWPVYALSLLREDSADGALLNYEKTAQLLSQALPNPIYADMSVYLGHGIVGGMLLDGGYHASLAIDLAEQILNGTPVEAVKPILESDNQWMFDARELERTGLGLENLPDESILINVEPSFYERYRNLVWLVVAIMVTGSVTITVLGNAIRRQKKAERQVAERTGALESALEKLSESQLQLVQHEKMASLGNLRVFLILCKRFFT